MPQGNGTFNDPYYINVGAITYLRVKASEFLGLAFLGRKQSDTEAFISAVRGDILALPNGSVFQFTIDDRIIEPSYTVYKDSDVLGAMDVDGPFFCAYPYVPAKSILHYLGKRTPTSPNENTIRNAINDFKQMLNDPLGKFDQSN